MKIVVSGGGTGGHIAPILAVLDSLQKLEPNLEVLFIGSGHDLERKILEQSGFTYTTVSSGKFRRYGRGVVREALDIKTTTQNIKDAVRFARGIAQARRVLRAFEPDVVFTKGGYVGAPVGLAAIRLHIPLVIHESDSVFGMANRLLAKRADVVAVGFPTNVYPSLKDVDRAKLVYTGNPVREDVVGSSTKRAEQFFPFDKPKPAVLVMGGSQGAQAINRVIFEGLERLSKNYNIIHLTGERDIERARFLHHKLPEDQKTSYMPFSFLQQEMGLAYSRADVAIARAGMGALMELAANNKPSIVVPLPSAADQPSNARILSRLGAIRVLQQADLSVLKLSSEIDRLLSDHEATEYLVDIFHKFYKADAAEHMAKLINGQVQKESK